MRARVVAVGNVAETVMGQAPPGEDCNKEGKGIVFVKAGEFSDPEPLIREWTTNPLKLAKKGDVLVCVVGATAGKVNLGIDCAIGRSVAAVRPDPKHLNTAYLHYFLHTQTDRLRAASQGLAQGVITREMLSKLEIPLPPIDEQRRIAMILDKADALRRNRKRAVELLAKASNSFIESAIDKFAGGKAQSLGESLEFMTTGGRNWSQYYADIGARFIRSLDVQMNGISNEEMVFVDAPDNAEAARTCTRVGDVLLTVTGSRIGRVAALPPELAGSYVSQHVAILRPKPDRLRPSFLSYFLSSRGGQRQIAKWQYGQTKPGLNFKQIEGFEIPDIGVDRQASIEATVVNFEFAAEKLRVQQTELYSLFFSLQHRAFSGQL